MPKTSGLRKKYSATFKLAVVKTAKSSSVYAAARSHSVYESMVRRWKRQENQLLVAERSSTSRGEKRSRLSGGKVSQFTDLEAQVFEWLVGERQQRRRVTRKSVRAKAKQLHTDAGTAEQFSASAGWCANFFMRFRLTMRMKTHQSQRSPEDLIPTLTDFLLYLKKYFADHPAITKSSIFAMDETAVWFDSTGSRTVEVIGAQSVPLASTGHDKANVTVALCAAADGKKLLPYIIFKGKGKTAEDKELKARRDIVVSYSDNGWFNSDLTVDWLKRVMGTFAFVRRLLIWDSYRCHLCAAVKDTRRAQNIDCAVVPGGCTGLIQAPDVSWNKPFKGSIREQYDEWLATGEKTYTAAGNMRAMSKSKLCDVVVKAWQGVSAEVLTKSFECCGQVPGATADSVSCFKDGRPAASGREHLAERLALPVADICADNAGFDEAVDKLDHDAIVLGELEAGDSNGSGDERSSSDSSGSASEEEGGQ